MKTFVVLVDSLNRNYLSCYNPHTFVHAENLAAFAKENVQFDNHYLGSAPCMPARRDIFTGRLNFLERNWGPIEPFDITMIQKLRNNGIFMHIITDHPHYFDIGGENYCRMFNTWEFIRGQCGDPWVSRVAGTKIPEPHWGKVFEQNLLNRIGYQKEEDYPTPKCFQAACDWVENNRDADDYLLMIEVFDPHEPFDCTEEFIQMYQDNYDGPFFDWPSYLPLADETEEAMIHLRKRYAGTLSMMDRWFGKFIQKLKSTGIYEESLIIITTDHGHMLGEHGYAAKNFMPVYNELAHLPLIVHLPKGEKSGKHVKALTQNIDLMPTILEHHNVEIPATVQGGSLFHVIRENQSIRKAAIYGWFGMAVNITDGKHTYFRAPKSENNQPCYVYGAIPTTFLCYMNEFPEEIEMGRFLKHTNYPVYRIKNRTRNECEWSPDITHVKETMLFDLEKDFEQNHPLNDPALEADMINKLKKAMAFHDSPEEQYERLGLA